MSENRKNMTPTLAGQSKWVSKFGYGHKEVADILFLEEDVVQDVLSGADFQSVDPIPVKNYQTKEIGYLRTRVKLLEGKQKSMKNQISNLDWIISRLNQKENYCMAGTVVFMFFVVCFLFLTIFF